MRLFLPPGVQLPVGIGTMVALEELSTLDVARNSKEVLELGSLTKLKVLAIHCYATSAISEGIKNSLTSSLCKLGERNLRSVKLWTGTSGPSMDFLIDSWCPPPLHLQIFDSIGFNHFSSLPKWTSSLRELTCLKICIKQVGAGDLQMLEGLPALLCLHIYLKEHPQETLTISSAAFKLLKELWFRPPSHELGLMYMKNKKDRLNLVFEAGALPKLEQLHFGFAAHGTLSAYGVGFNFGISHLSSLKHLEICIYCWGAKTWEVEASQAPIRNAAALLPNRPTLEILDLSVEMMLMDDEQWVDSDSGGDEEDYVAGLLDGTNTK